MEKKRPGVCAYIERLLTIPRRFERSSHFGRWRPDCLAGHVRFELRNVVANYPFESSRGFPRSEPNSGHGDHSRLSCSAGDTQLGAGFCRDLQQALCTDVGHDSASPRRHELAAISFDPKMIRRATTSNTIALNRRTGAVSVSLMPFCLLPVCVPCYSVILSGMRASMSG